MLSLAIFTLRNVFSVVSNIIVNVTPPPPRKKWPKQIDKSEQINSFRQWLVKRKKNFNNNGIDHLPIVVRTVVAK